MAAKPKKKAPPRPAARTGEPLTAGESRWFECEQCYTEFEVTYEPKHKGYAGPSGSDVKSAAVTHCPFCGSDRVVDPNAGDA